jgi:uncharacterized protein YggL (DUF469 family)
MRWKMIKGVEISGVLYADDGDIDHNEFLDAFIDFVESKNWNFGGSVKTINEDGNTIKS